MLHSVRRGDGPPLVLLAGIGMAAAAWDPVADRLARERELWAVDLPGFGGSTPFAAGAPSGIEALADHVEAFLGESGLDRPHAAGNSLGGAIALELGRRGAVASVTALSPAGFAGAAGGEFAYRSLLLTHRVSRALHTRGPATFARPGVRRLLCGQIFAHPERLTPDRGLRERHDPGRRRRLPRGARRARGLPLRRAGGGAGHDRVGHARRPPAADAGAAGAAGAAGGAARLAARVRARADERRPGAGGGGAAGGQRGPAAAASNGGR